MTRFNTYLKNTGNTLGLLFQPSRSRALCWKLGSFRHRRYGDSVREMCLASGVVGEVEVEHADAPEKMIECLGGTGPVALAKPDVTFRSGTAVFAFNRLCKYSA